MPEYGMLPIPDKLLRQGVRDMVRVSDARMSGTSYGTCVLHVAPESFVGGPLALVHDGDLITLDVAGRRLELEVRRRGAAEAQAGVGSPEEDLRAWVRRFVQRAHRAGRHRAVTSTFSPAAAPPSEPDAR